MTPVEERVARALIERASETGGSYRRTTGFIAIDVEEAARAAIAVVVEEAANEVIRRIAEAAEAVGWQAGVGGSELAGGIVSYLCEHPEHTQTFLAEGYLSLPGDIWAEGRLTFLNSRGEVTTPQTLRRARTVRRLERSAEPLAKPGGQR